MKATPLLAVTAFLLLLSGGVKLRAVARVGMGIGILPLFEVVAAFVLVALAMLGAPTPLVGLWAILGGVLLILGSSFQVGAALGRRRRMRELSEAARLRTYVQYAGAATDRNLSTRPPRPRVQPNDPPGPGKSL